LTLATELGIIDKSGAWYSYNGKNLGQGEFNMMAILKEDEALYNELRNIIIERTGLKKYYERHE
jgi:recombination protein RecA